MNRRYTIFILAFAASRASAQEVPQLPISISLGAGLAFYDRPEGTAGTAIGTRFLGSIALPLSQHWSIGFSIASWARNTGDSENSHDLLARRAEAVHHHLFAQRLFPLGKLALSVRAGAGLTRTATFSGLETVIEQTVHLRGSVSTGAGIDIPLVKHVYLTPAVAYAKILSTDRSIWELRYGIWAGVAVTVR